MNVTGLRRRSLRSRLTGPMALVALVAGLGILMVGGLWWIGALNLDRFGFGGQPSTRGLTAVPVSARPIAAYTAVTRDDFWDARNARLAVIYLRPQDVSPRMLTSLGDLLGRVLSHDKSVGYAFTEDDFLPRGTRPGLVGGIPTNKRAIRVEADKVGGLFGLQPGDRFDLVSTIPIDAGNNANANAFQNLGGAYAPQLQLQAQLTNWRKQAVVRILVQNGSIVQPLVTRQVPVFANSLTQGAVTRMRPVQEIVIAVDPDEVAPLTEAMAVGAVVSAVPRSGRPDDDPRSRTPESRPTSPLATGPFGAPPPATDPAASDAPGTGGTMPMSGSVAMVERISGLKRELAAVPQR